MCESLIILRLVCGSHIDKSNGECMACSGTKMMEQIKPLKMQVEVIEVQ